jgi:uncharacterized protein (DUF2252 family)
MHSCDPHALVRAQRARDRRRCAPFPGLFEHKLRRMRVSPLAFLRGAAPLFYAVLRDHPELARGPRGEGWISGDLHLENFGAYRPESLAEEVKKKHGREDVAFDLNDFDDAVQGPWRFDVLRLTTSLLLAGRELRVGGDGVLGLAEGLLDSYTEHACQGERLPPPPRPVAELLERVRARTRDALLDGRTHVIRGRRAFARDEHYQDISPALEPKARDAFGAYAARLCARDALPAEHFEVLDLAFRVAGTGSLGGVRVAVLVRGKGGSNGAWIFDMKEQGTPSSAQLAPDPERRGKGGRLTFPPDPAVRVVTAMTACLARPPRMLGVTKLGGRPMLVRRLAPQEDKLNLGQLRADDLLTLARYLGALTGAAHRRGATRLPGRAWSKSDHALIVQNAITLAGLHEAAYLSLCGQG